MCYSGSKVGKKTPPGLLAEAGTFALWLRSGLPCSAGATQKGRSVCLIRIPGMKFWKMVRSVQGVSSIDSYHSCFALVSKKRIGAILSIIRAYYFQSMFYVRRTRHWRSIFSPQAQVLFRVISWQPRVQLFQARRHGGTGEFMARF